MHTDLALWMATTCSGATSGTSTARSTADRLGAALPSPVGEEDRFTLFESMTSGLPLSRPSKAPAHCGELAVRLQPRECRGTTNGLCDATVPWAVVRLTQATR